MPSDDNPSRTVIKGLARARASIDAIEGIGVMNATTLRNARIRTTEALLKAGAARKGRKDLAEALGFSEHQILEWVKRADLMRVKGVGEEYSDLLEAAGADSVKELSTRNPGRLLAKLAAVNEQKHLVRRLPTESMVTRWVGHAKDLGPLVKY